MIRLLVVDDEVPARAKVRRLLEEVDDFEIVAEAADGIEALAALARGGVDAVFLDIQMPRLDGFGVVTSVGPKAMPPVVFVTAYDEHALQAFEVAAVDYLLKPFAASRFARVLDRLRERLAAPAATAAEEAQITAVSEAVRGGRRHLLARRSAEREVLVRIDHIDLLRAADGQVEVHTAEGVLHRRGPLTALEERLDPQEFLRINRGEIVRLDAVREIQPWFRGDARIVLRDGSILHWSRRYRARGGFA